MTTVYNDRVRSYRTPLPEGREIAGPMTFSGGRVDGHLDGVLQRRPKAAFQKFRVSAGAVIGAISLAPVLACPEVCDPICRRYGDVRANV